MPDVFLWATPEWLPTIAEARQLPPGFPPAEWSVTSKLVDMLPRTVAAVVGNADNEDLMEYEVVVIPQSFHPWSVNTPDIWIDIQCGARPDLAVDAQRIRRATIVDGVLAAVKELFEEQGVSPVYDVECRPITATGISIGGSSSPLMAGEMRWGYPESSPN